MGLFDVAEDDFFEFLGDDLDFGEAEEVAGDEVG